MKKLCLILLSLLMVLGLAACNGTGEKPSSPQPSENTPADVTPSEQPPAESAKLLISAAASLTEALNEIAANYAAVAPGVKLTINYGSSGALQTQIENGAPADIFFSAANKQMDALDGGGLMLSDSIVRLLKNEIVLIVPQSSAFALTGFEDAAGDSVKKIALGDVASVPAGQYAQDTFTALGIWDKVSAKAVFGSDVKQVLSWVSSGDADCGVVYSTDAASDGTVKVFAQAPADTHKDIVYPVGIVKASAQQDAAADFIAYLQSDEGMAVFMKYGFLAG